MTLPIKLLTTRLASMVQFTEDVGKLTTWNYLTRLKALHRGGVADDIFVRGVTQGGDAKGKLNLFTRCYEGLHFGWRRFWNTFVEVPTEKFFDTAKHWADGLRRTAAAKKAVQELPHAIDAAKTACSTRLVTAPKEFLQGLQSLCTKYPGLGQKITMQFHSTSPDLTDDLLRYIARSHRALSKNGPEFFNLPAGSGPAVLADFEQLLQKGGIKVTRYKVGDICPPEGAKNFDLSFRPTADPKLHNVIADVDKTLNTVYQGASGDPIEKAMAMVFKHTAPAS